MTNHVFANYTQSQLDVQYNARAAVPEFAQFAERWTLNSERTRLRLNCILDVSYGDGAREKLDVFHPEARNAPVQVFFHGGYWRSMNKEVFSFVAEPFVQKGALAVIVEYTLCPAVTIDHIVAQCRRAVAWVYQNAARLGGDARRIFLSGHSAGGHIVAKLLETDWSALPGAGHPLAGACALSGLYDLEPIRLSFLNEDLRLQPEQARRNSAIHGVTKTPTPLLLSVGELESAEFHRQTNDYKAAWEAAGNACQLIPAPGRHHYSLLDAFCDQANSLGRAVLSQMALYRH